VFALCKAEDSHAAKAAALRLWGALWDFCHPKKCSLIITVAPIDIASSLPEGVAVSRCCWLR
jgi:hypothetical protein